MNNLQFDFGNIQVDPTSCAFTGHRRIQAKHVDVLQNLIARAIDYAYGEGCRRFFCGGALGFDTLAAKEVVHYKLLHPDCELHMLIPCKTQSVMWSGEAASMYDYILSAASTVTYISEIYTDKCMQERNKRLVECADILIAYASREISGAGQTIRLAKKKGIPVYNLYSAADSQTNIR